MKLDRVLTVAVGDMTADNQRLSDSEFKSFQTSLNELLTKHGTVVAHATGDGIGSDDERNGTEEKTAAFIVINPTEVGVLRRGVAQIIKTWRQSSACFSLDTEHEPVFDTPDGMRVA